MIPRDYITEWRADAPWVQDFQVEQDLVICRALVNIFRHPLLRDALAFRGGTALYKLYLLPAARYSEDIDLVQLKAGLAGDMMSALREGCAAALLVPPPADANLRPTDDVDCVMSITSYAEFSALEMKLRE